MQNKKVFNNSKENIHRFFQTIFQVPLPRENPLIALIRDGGELLYVLGGAQIPKQKWISTEHLWRFNFLTKNWTYIPLCVEDEKMLNELRNDDISYNIAHSKRIILFIVLLKNIIE